MPSFIRVIETWLPSDDGSLLEFGQGLYHAAPGFGTVSRTMCFGRGEGLPGRAWDEGRPVLMPRLDAGTFLRTAAAHAAGLHCAVALPCFVQERFAAVVVLLCGGEAGAIELWHHDPRINSDMTLVEGCFGGHGPLAEVSRDTYLPRGAGLPGLAWQRGETVFLPDLADAAGRFLRADEALQAGLQQGLAVPFETRTNEACVLTVLANQAEPVARGIERWGPATAASTEPTCLFSHWPDPGAVPQAQVLMPALMSAFASGLPALVEAPSPQAGAFAVLPLTNAGQVSELLVLGL